MRLIWREPPTPIADSTTAGDWVLSSVAIVSGDLWSAEGSWNVQVATMLPVSNVTVNELISTDNRSAICVLNDC